MNAKTETIQIRLTSAEKAGFELAAELAGIPVSSWVRERLRLTAIRKRGKKNPVRGRNPTGRK
jgi:hypothetical protein